MYLKNLGVIVCLLALQPLHAQIPDLELTLRYNLTDLRYEVFARPNASLTGFNWGPSQISVLTPASVADEALTVTSVAAGAWQDNSRVYAPAASPGFDFHGVGSLGSTINLTANAERLIFHFTLPGGGCIPGLRLYINGVDPGSSGAGMNGGDFSNTVFAVVPAVPEGYESYIGNYENSGSVCLPLPLELLSFQAAPSKTSIELDWKTVWETGFDHFNLERSENAIDFITITTIRGTGSGTYSFSDQTVKPGIGYYYRLKMTDSDQTFSYSHQVYAALKDAALSVVNLAPNPTTGFFRLQLNAGTASQASISITDMTGRLMEQQTVGINSGLNTYHFDLRRFPPAVYLLFVDDNTSHLIKRIVRTD